MRITSKTIDFAQAIATMNPHEVLFEINRGGRFVIFQYCISLLVITFRRPTSIKFIKAGESAMIKSLPYTTLSLVFGWWGFPWGFIYTPQVIYKNLNGGIDVTQDVLANLQGATISAPPPFVN